MIELQVTPTIPVTLPIGSPRPASNVVIDVSVASPLLLQQSREPVEHELAGSVRRVIFVGVATARVARAVAMRMACLKNMVESLICSLG